MYNAPSYSSYAPVQTGPRIGEWLSEAFTLFGREWQTWLAQGAILLFLGMGPYFAGYILFFVTVLAAGAASSGRGSDAAAAGGALMGMGMFGIGALVSVLLIPFLLIGMKRTAAKQLRGEPISVGDIFSGGDVYLPCLGVALASGLCIGVASYACLVPGLLLAGLWSLALPIVVEKRAGVMDAMRESWYATKPHMWMWVLWVFVINLVGSAGAAAAIIGVAATYPIYVIATMIAYRDTIGIAGAVAPASAVPTVPMTPGTNYGPAGAPIATARCPACERPVAAGAVMCPHCQTSIPSGYTSPSGVNPPTGFNPPPAGFSPPPTNPGEPGV